MHIPIAYYGGLRVDRRGMFYLEEQDSPEELTAVPK
jgi:hypothetical protein